MLRLHLRRHRSWSHREPISQALRRRVLDRDGHRCVYCGRKPPEVKLHIDHVKPVSRGGKTEPSNLRTACAPCNLAKGSRLIKGRRVETQVRRYRTQRRRELGRHRHWWMLWLA